MAAIEAAVTEPPFAAYIDFILVSLHCYSLHLIKLDEALIGSSRDHVLDVARQEQPTFDRLFDSHLRLLEQHARSLPLLERLKEGQALRAACESLIRQAPFMHRTNVKPRGYQGDSEMMRMVYENDYRGETLFGMMLHKHIISTPAADAVRNRRALVTRELRDWVRTHKSSAPVEVLSVACGPAYEIADIFRDQADFQKFRITLLDQDGEALGEAHQEIQAAETRCSGKVDVRYVKKSIGALLRPGSVRDGLGKFDFIYSMGLYDYLDGRTAKKLTNALFDMLKPGGALLLGNYSKTNPTRYYLEYWCDWPLEYRDEKELAALLEPSHPARVEVGVEPSGCQLFLRVREGGGAAAPKAHL
ncbi:hypothetical protein H2203_005054 [Taxawa tesnikishii (nom. ined.)]|nr:hypothetical protein H2203_005054 [Dothideales sp. JES 119]